jgi:hypothetical protein
VSDFCCWCWCCCVLCMLMLRGGRRRGTGTAPAGPLRAPLPDISRHSHSRGASAISGIGIAHHSSQLLRRCHTHTRICLLPSSCILPLFRRVLRVPCSVHSTPPPLPRRFRSQRSFPQLKLKHGPPPPPRAPPTCMCFFWTNGQRATAPITASARARHPAAWTSGSSEQCEGVWGLGARLELGRPGGFPLHSRCIPVSGRAGPQRPGVASCRRRSRFGNSKQQALPRPRVHVRLVAPPPDASQLHHMCRGACPLYTRARATERRQCAP